MSCPAPSWPDSTCVLGAERRRLVLFALTYGGFILRIFWFPKGHMRFKAIFCCCSVNKSCPTLCDPWNAACQASVHNQLPELTQTHVHWVGDAIQLSHSLLSPFPPTFNLSQHQGLFQWIGSSHQVNKVLELQLQHQLFQGIFRVDFLAVQVTLKSLL